MLGEQRIGREACRPLSLFFCVVLVPVAAPEDVEREVVFSVHISLLTVLAYLHPAVAVYLHVHLPVLRVEVVHVIVKAEQTVIDTHINEWLYSMYVQGGFPIKYTKRASRFAPSI